MGLLYNSRKRCSLAYCMTPEIVACWLAIEQQRGKLVAYWPTVLLAKTLLIDFLYDPRTRCLLVFGQQRRKHVAYCPSVVLAKTLLIGLLFDPRNRCLVSIHCTAEGEARCLLACCMTRENVAYWLSV